MIVNNLFYICNALDDVTRQEREIITDSPAASRKVFLMCQAARQAGVRTWVISMGRGQQNGSGHFFHSKVTRINGVATIYLPFLHYPILSELLSLFSAIPLIWRLHQIKGKKTVLFYNRLPVYLLTLITAKVLRLNTVLDLEDGETDLNKWSMAGVKSRIFRNVFDLFCSGGALLACQALRYFTNLRPTQCCYGTSETSNATQKWNIDTVTVLLGGTLSHDTGTQLLINAINMMRADSSPWVKKLRFEITGKGDCLNALIKIGDKKKYPFVFVHGRTTDIEYKAILARTQVGLALKPNFGKLAHTTFPSKVIEFASNGILVLTTDISDVKKVLVGSAIYLTDDNPLTLIEKLRWIVENRMEAEELSLKGIEAVASVCAPKIVGENLKQFLFQSSSGVSN